MEVDFTNWWVPAVTMVILGTYVFFSGFNEARMPMPVAPAPREADAHAEGGEAAPVAAAPIHADEKAKRGFLFRTSWIWGSVLVGAVAQAYLSYLAP
ncbi:MAG: hypothetical protein RLN89_04660 [Parvibaculum sp.]